MEESSRPATPEAMEVDIASDVTPTTPPVNFFARVPVLKYPEAVKAAFMKLLGEGQGK